MTRKMILRYEITERLIELAELEKRSVLAEMEDMINSFKLIMDEIPVEERDPSVVWT